MLDAPVSGGDKGAIAGTLSIMVGGDEEVFSRCMPIFQALGKTIVHVGASGAGQTVKACNQVVVALTIEAVSEALVLGSKAGVDPAKILQVLSVTLFEQVPILQAFGDVESQEKSDGISNQLNLWGL